MKQHRCRVCKTRYDEHCPNSSAEWHRKADIEISKLLHPSNYEYGPGWTPDGEWHGGDAA